MEIPVEETMLFKYACKDMGLNCSFVVKGTTMEEVTRQALEHVREKHKDDFNRFDSPGELEKMAQALSRSTKVVPG
jgi:predicted small metal-binding protein